MFGQLVDAALERAAGVLVEAEDLRHGASFSLITASHRTIRHADDERPGCGCSPGRRRDGLLLDDGEDVAGGQDEVLVAAVLDLGAAVLAVEDDVADGDVERNAVAVVVDAARADGEDGALLGLLLGGVRNDDAGGGGRLGLVGLHDDAVLERLDADLGGGHGGSPLLGV